MEDEWRVESSFTDANLKKKKTVLILYRMGIFMLYNFHVVDYRYTNFHFKIYGPYIMDIYMDIYYMVHSHRTIVSGCEGGIRLPDGHLARIPHRGV